MALQVTMVHHAYKTLAMFYDVAENHLCPHLSLYRVSCHLPVYKEFEHIDQFRLTNLVRILVGLYFSMTFNV